MKTIITYGTFDTFHVGHVRLIRRLRNLGERLIVAVSTDEFNALKGKRALVPYEQRKEVIESLRDVDLVIPETCWEQKLTDIREYAVDIFAMGDDWAGKFDFLLPYCQVLYLERTKGVSSSQLREAHTLKHFNGHSLSSKIGDSKSVQQVCTAGLSDT